MRFASEPGTPINVAVPMPWASRVRARCTGGQWITLGLLLFAAVWLAHLSYASLSPPTDNIEQLTWVRSIEWGYYKHPPLPTWLIWLPVRIFGLHAWTSYATGAAFTLGSMGMLWHLLSSLRGRRYATLALLAALCITYYNGRLYYYNHNIVLMFFSTASAMVCWKAHATGRLRWWAALGIALGLGALAKYQIAVTMTSVLIFWLLQRGWRDPRQRLGLLLTALIALLIFVPHLQWLRTHDFMPIQYAMESSLGAHLGAAARWQDALHWIIDQVLNRAMPAWLVLAAAIRGMRVRGVFAALPSPARLGAKQDQAASALLLSWGLVPLAFMPLAGVLTGADLQLQWGTPFLLFAVPAAMELLRDRVAWSSIPLRPAFKAFLALQLLLLILSHITSPRGLKALDDRHWRSFDSAALARLLDGPVHEVLSGAEPCVVSGPGAQAGALALQLSGQPLVLIDGRFDRSPWVSADRAKRCGLLELHEGPPMLGEQLVGNDFPGLSWRMVAPAVDPAIGTGPSASASATD